MLTTRSSSDVLEQYKAICMVVIAQLLTACMAAMAKILETLPNDGQIISPIQVLLVRQLISSGLCGLYMWAMQIPDAPFGKREVRALLAARAFGGFFGVFGFYYSLQSLTIADATVLALLAPILSSIACAALLGHPYTRTQQLVNVLSLIGAVAVTKPTIIFGVIDEASISRLNGTIYAVIGVFGFASAYTTIRWIGKQANPVLSVFYFSVWCVVASAVFLGFAQEARFAINASPSQWALLVLTGICGFSKQVLLTAGLSQDQGKRTMNVVYVQVVLAIALDKLVWDTSPDLMSMVGATLITCSTLYGSRAKDLPHPHESKQANSLQCSLISTVDEEKALE